MNGIVPRRSSSAAAMRTVADHQRGRQPSRTASTAVRSSASFERSSTWRITFSGDIGSIAVRGQTRESVASRTAASWSAGSTCSSAASASRCAAASCVISSRLAACASAQRRMPAMKSSPPVAAPSALRSAALAFADLRCWTIDWSSSRCISCPMRWRYGPSCASAADACSGESFAFAMARSTSNCAGPSLAALPSIDRIARRFAASRSRSSASRWSARVTAATAWKSESTSARIACASARRPCSTSAIACSSFGSLPCRARIASIRRFAANIRSCASSKPAFATWRCTSSSPMASAIASYSLLGRTGFASDAVPMVSWTWPSAGRQRHPERARATAAASRIVRMGAVWARTTPPAICGRRAGLRNSPPAGGISRARSPGASPASPGATGRSRPRPSSNGSPRERRSRTRAPPRASGPLP